MYERRRARILLATLSLVSLVLITLDFRSGDDGPVDRLRDGTTAVFGPIQDGVATVLRPIGALIDNVGDLFTLRADNARLVAKLAELEARRSSVEDVMSENERLRALLEVQEELSEDSDEFRFLTARVTGMGGSNTDWTITIDAGTRRGVREDMTVINGDGLVGRVVQATPLTSRVLLAVDPTFSAASRLASNGEQGILKGQGQVPMRLSLIDPEADVEPGDELVTSSYENGTFPNGIPIGEIATVDDGGNQLSRDATVQPFVDFTRLDVVTVILRAPPPAPPTPTASPSPSFSPASPAPSGSPTPSTAP